MPLYEFTCIDCGHTFELTMDISEVSRQVFCLTCGRVARRKWRPIPAIWPKGAPTTKRGK